MPGEMRALGKGKLRLSRGLHDDSRDLDWKHRERRKKEVTICFAKTVSSSALRHVREKRVHGEYTWRDAMAANCGLLRTLREPSPNAAAGELRCHLDGSQSGQVPPPVTH
jgi:hypothetical protein